MGNDVSTVRRVQNGQSHGVQLRLCRSPDGDGPVGQRCLPRGEQAGMGWDGVSMKVTNYPEAERFVR